jgi:hypothetical protein
MTEREGCEVLRQRFQAAGAHIVDHCRIDELGLAIELDGFDPDRRIGYEYITTAAGDRVDITPAVVAELERRMAAGELFVLLIDEVDIDGPALLERAADGFLDQLRRMGRLP